MKAIGKGARTARVIMIAILCFMAIFEIFPLIWMFDFSLGSATDVFAGKLLMIPDPVQWDNYAAAWTQGRVPQYFLNSVICVGCAIVLTVFIALTTGYACSRMDWKLSKFVYFLSIIGMMIPMHATLLPNYIIANQLGILNTYLVLILNYTARQIPFAIMVTCAFMESIPRALEEAAVIDGAGIYRIVFTIILPLITPAMMTVGITSFMNCWNDFILALTLITKDDLRTIPFSVYRFMSLYGADYAKQYAVMILSTIPMLIVYIAFNEHITKGVMLGAVKA